MRCRGSSHRQLVRLMTVVYGFFIVPKLSFFFVAPRLLSGPALLPFEEAAPPVEDPSVFLAVVSRPSDVEVRTVIRNTWASDLPAGCALRFFVGVPESDADLQLLEQERNSDEDLVILDNVLDNYANLTLKTIATFNWLKDEVTQDFVMKVDTDVYVSMSRLLHYLASSPGRRLYLGDVKSYGPKNSPIRHEHPKWRLTQEEYNLSRFPPYAFGSAYVVSRDLVEPIADCLPKDLACTSNGSFGSCELSKDCTFRPMKFEDVSVGGILSCYLTGDRRIDLQCETWKCEWETQTSFESTIYYEPRIVDFPWDPWHLRHKCNDDFLAFHRVTPRMMKAYFDGKEGRIVPMCSLYDHDEVCTMYSLPVESC